ncbi:MAG TPA: PadR family transcriptional regulator [Pseudonocardiaceae bacterium]
MISGPGTLTPLALAVLELLHEGPKHPYDIHQTMRDRHTDRLLKLTPGTLYHTIERLARDGMVEMVETSREGRRPERTTYRITPCGRETFASKVRQIASQPSESYPEFALAMSLLHTLNAEDGTECLRDRCAELQAEIAARQVWVDHLTAVKLPEMYWIDVKYRLAMVRAELAWVNEQLDRLRRGDLGWPDWGSGSNPVSTAELRVVPDDRPAGEIPADKAALKQARKSARKSTGTRTTTEATG